MERSMKYVFVLAAALVALCSSSTSSDARLKLCKKAMVYVDSGTKCPK